MAVPPPQSAMLDVERADGALYERLLQSHQRLFGRYQDTRSRRNRTQDLVDAFEKQIPAMADAYLKWSLESRDEGLGFPYALPEDAVVQETRQVLVVDVFAAYHADLKLIPEDRYVSSGCVRQGWMPVAAYFPTVVISLRALEIYRVMNLRCPRLGIQPFVRALCDIHGVAPRPWLASQFSVAFDVYLAIRAVVDGRVKVALGRNTPDWRLKNTCLSCLYKLEGEPSLPLPLLGTYDGNNSLSRFEIREKEKVLDDGTTAPGASKERFDNREVPGDYYLPRAEVDKWAKEGLDELMKGFVLNAEPGHDDEEDGCGDRWQNMKEDVTCARVGDVRRDGDLSRVVPARFRPRRGRHGEERRALEVRPRGDCPPPARPGPDHNGQLVADKQFMALIGAFHGHGHGRFCARRRTSRQYVTGVGLEGLEGCESYFSNPNALAATTRHASRCHRQQAIVNYMAHTDKSTRTKASVRFVIAFCACVADCSILAAVLSSKYLRALEIRATHSTLREAMQRLGVQSRDVFETWLEEEKSYLRTLSKEPLEETMEMEYYQKLVNLQDA
ncbi:hypothetical protein DFH09DRAFT_1092678, partial [Mycena vulgaris]